MNTKQLTWPSIESQKQFWINKEAKSDNATNETCEELIESTVDKIEQYATIHDFTQVGHCVREAIDKGIQNFLCNYDGRSLHVSKTGAASHLNNVDSDTVGYSSKSSTDQLSRTESLTDWYDHERNDLDRGDLRDGGRNPDGSGLSYGERNA